MKTFMKKYKYQRVFQSTKSLKRPMFHKNRMIYFDSEGYYFILTIITIPHGRIEVWKLVRQVTKDIWIFVDKEK